MGVTFESAGPIQAGIFDSVCKGTNKALISRSAARATRSSRDQFSHWGVDLSLEDFRQVRRELSTSRAEESSP